MRVLGMTFLAFTATWLLTLVWRPLGVGLTYWETIPLGAAAILLFAAMAALMSVGFEPVQLDGHDADAVADLWPLGVITQARSSERPTPLRLGRPSRAFD